MKDMTIGERIRQARERMGISQVDLADRINTSKQNLYKYENGIITNIPSDKIEAIARETKTTPSFLMGWSTPDEKKRAPVTFPVLGSVSCGEPQLMAENLDVYTSDADFALYAKGDSMTDARINDGDLVFIKRQPTVENGQIAAVAIDDAATLKRFYKYDGLIVLRACNPAYKDIEIRESDGENVVVLGLAVAFQSKVQ